jgi:D-beta-D-heptose 7-phosphate kinase / D-beta-D-heptose 1-phosphate adenosyltransferase
VKCCLNRVSVAKFHKTAIEDKLARMSTANRLADLVRAMQGKTVALAGDVMIDKYVYGNAERLSPEAPVPVLHYSHEESRLGGAGHVAADLAVLGCNVNFVACVSNDVAGNEVRSLLKQFAISDQLLHITQQRCTTSKVRLVGMANARGAQQLIRLDYEVPKPIEAEDQQQVLARFEQSLAGAQVVLLEDYNKGTLTAKVCQKMIQLARGKGLEVLIDPANLPDYSKYAGASCLKLNRVETEKATGLSCRKAEHYAAAAKSLLEKLNLDCVVITLDKDGAFLATKQGVSRQLATRARQVADVTGAGDMVLAALGAARAAGADWTEAVTLANVAGGLEVERFGAVPIKPDEIILELMGDANYLGKERSLETLLPELLAHRAAGKKIVFTNGCFDLIHLGHVKYFQFAKAQGDLLVVGVNTDSSISRLKGPKRPVVNEVDRVGVLEELESIDYLVRFDTDTPLELIRAIEPDVLVKGADYAKEQVVGWDIVEARGGHVALAPLIDGRSTSNVIKRILDAYGSESR